MSSISSVERGDVLLLAEWLDIVQSSSVKVMIRDAEEQNSNTHIYVSSLRRFPIDCSKPNARYSSSISPCSTTYQQHMHAFAPAFQSDLVIWAERVQVTTSLQFFSRLFDILFCDFQLAAACRYWRVCSTVEEKKEQRIATRGHGITSSHLPNLDIKLRPPSFSNRSWLGQPY